MQTEEVTFNRRTVGGAGIAWAIVQFLSVPLGMILLYVNLNMHMLTPPVLVLIAWDKLFTIFSFLPRYSNTVFFVSALILSLLIIGLTIGVYRRNFVCAVLLFIDVAAYLIIAVYGLFIRRTFFYDFNTFMYGRWHLGQVFTNVQISQDNCSYHLSSSYLHSHAHYVGR